MTRQTTIALIKGDGIGVDVAEATVSVVDAAVSAAGVDALSYSGITAGGGDYKATGLANARWHRNRAPFTLARSLRALCCCPAGKGLTERSAKARRSARRCD